MPLSPTIETTEDVSSSQQDGKTGSIGLMPSTTVSASPDVLRVCFPWIPWVPLAAALLIASNTLLWRVLPHKTAQIKTAAVQTSPTVPRQEVSLIPPHGTSVPSTRGTLPQGSHASQENSWFVIINSYSERNRKTAEEARDKLNHVIAESISDFDGYVGLIDTHLYPGIKTPKHHLGNLVYIGLGPFSKKRAYQVRAQLQQGDISVLHDEPLIRLGTWRLVSPSA